MTEKQVKLQPLSLPQLIETDFTFKELEQNVKGNWEIS